MQTILILRGLGFLLLNRLRPIADSRGGDAPDTCITGDALAVDYKGGCLSLPAQYDRFLYALLDPSAGASITMLSALARLDLDPWEEATRLTALPAAQAETSLASTLHRLDGAAENLALQATANRLVSLLPAIQMATKQTTPVAEPPKVQSLRGSNFWLLWLCIQLFLFIFVSVQGKTAKGVSSGTSSSSAALSTKGSSLKPAPSAALQDATSPKTDAAPVAAANRPATIQSQQAE